MVRMTRAERQEATRNEILAAARHRFLRDGYSATSLEQIAEDAGYSKGAVYSNFRDKPSLCRDVLLSVHEAKLGEIATITTSGIPVEDMLGAVELWLRRTVGDVGWTMLEMEFAVVARDNPALNHMITAVHEGLHAMIVGALEAVAAELGLEDSERARELLREQADLLVATTFGLGVRRAVDPGVSIKPALDVLGMILESVEELSEESA